MRLIICTSLILLLYTESFSQFVKEWEITEGLEVAESVVYDKKRNLLYISNYTRPLVNGSSYSDCSVSRVDPQGKIIEKDWITELTSPTGLFLKDDLLYIVERFGVVIYDIEKQRLIKRYHIAGTGFINDVAVDHNGSIYVTDSGSNKLYRIKDNEVSNWIVSDSVANANGISFIDNKLYIGVNKDGYLRTIDPETGVITNVVHIGEGNIDGIKKRGDQFILSLYKKGMLLVDKDGKITEFLNIESTGLHCTDFEYVEELDMIVVPSLYDNTVVAYKFLN